MKIRITGKRKLPKAKLGMTTDSCPEGQVWDEESGQCVDGYWDPITHSAVKSGDLTDNDYWDNKEIMDPIINDPSFSSLSAAVGERNRKQSMGMSLNPWKTTGNEGTPSNPMDQSRVKPDTSGHTCAEGYRWSEKIKQCVPEGPKNNLLNKAYFFNEAVLNPLMNTGRLISSQIEQNTTGKQGERKRRMLDLNEYSLPVRQTRLGNFTHVMDSGLFDPRNTGFKSEGMATNPFSAPIGRYMAGGGQYDSLMPHAQPMQMSSEMIPAAEYSPMPTSMPTSAGAPSTSAAPTSSSSVNHKFAPADRKYNKNTVITPDEITFLDAPQMNVDKVLDVLASNEKSAIGNQTNLVGPNGQRASAMGRWGITSGTRQGIYEKNFKGQMSIGEFENKYNTDPNFEREVARKLVEEMLPKYGSLIFGAWYYPEYAEKYLTGDTKVLNMVPRADYGNAITWGGYLKKAQDKYFKLDNPVATSDFLSGATDFANQFNFDITSTNQGQHNVGSKHYTGNAMDVRTRNKSDKEIADFIQEAERRGYKVLDERQRPAGQPVWGGPHLHIQTRKFGGQNNNKTMKIRIVSGPNQKMAYGGQSAYALNLGHRDVYAPMNKNPYDKSSKTIGPVPREEANIEAERGETVYGDINGDGQNEHMQIGGERHTNGGTPLKVPEGSFIFSDTKKMMIKDEQILRFFGMTAKKGGYTPAEIAKKYDVNKYRGVLENPQSDVVQKRTAERMIENYEAKLGYLALIQESKKGFPQGIPEIAEKVVDTQLGQQIAGEYLQQQQQMMQQQQGEKQMPQPGGEEPNGVQEYPEGQEPQQQGPQEEMMEGQQEPPMQEGMEQMPPMQRYGGGIGYYAQGGYVPEDLGMMAYGGYAPVQTFALGGTSADPIYYNKYANAVISKQGAATIIKYPDGQIDTIFPNGRVKIQYSNGTSKMVDAAETIVDIKKTSDGTPIVIYGNGTKMTHFKNGRSQYIYADGRKTMGTVDAAGKIKWEDETDNTQAAPAQTTTPAQGTSASSQNVPANTVGSTPNVKNFKDVKEISDYYKQFGYNGPENIDKLQKWIIEQAGGNNDIKAELVNYLNEVPLTNKGLRLAKKLRKTKSQFTDDELFNQFNDALYDYRFPKLEKFKTPPSPPVVQVTPGTPAGPTPTPLPPVYQCVNGVVSAVDDASKVPGQTYYATDAEAQAACKQPTGSTTETKPNEFTPVGSDVPYGRMRQDVRNIGAANLNAALIKRFIAPRMNVNAEFSPFVARDPRFDVATRQAQFNMVNGDLQQYGAPQAYMANSSLAAGRTGEGAAQDIKGVNDYNVTGYNQKLAQDAAMANQFAMYNAQNALSSRQEDQGNESKYLKALGQGYDRIAAAKNQADTNAAMLAGVNATSPYFYYNPWDQDLRFNSDEARAAYFNNLKNPDAYSQTEADRRYALYKKYVADGTDPKIALGIINGNGGGYTTDYEYDQDRKKNKQVTKTPTPTVQKYGGYVMNNPYLK